MNSTILLERFFFSKLATELSINTQRSIHVHINPLLVTLCLFLNFLFEQVLPVLIVNSVICLK